MAGHRHAPGRRVHRAHGRGPDGHPRRAPAHRHDGVLLRPGLPPDRFRRLRSAGGAPAQTRCSSADTCDCRA
ncbi:hypothetical protein [Ornithinimicrobium kibberense]|uniref:hypothetical protein n=1 Tax=Ornithinimicrobium kibberense TaxID=282060 RepID=UPI0036205C6B